MKEIEVTPTLTVGDLDDMPDALPRLVRVAHVPQTELIADRKPDLTTLKLGQPKPRHTLLVQTKIPTDDDIGLSLRTL